MGKNYWKRKLFWNLLNKYWNLCKDFYIDIFIKNKLKKHIFIKNHSQKADIKTLAYRTFIKLNSRNHVYLKSTEEVIQQAE